MRVFIASNWSDGPLWVCIRMYLLFSLLDWIVSLSYLRTTFSSAEMRGQSVFEILHDHSTRQKPDGDVSNSCKIHQ